jgi:hypothetical protein
MIDPDPVPRPGLFTNGDNDAWTEQVLFLRTVLRMPFWQIAAIDYGILPEHPENEVIPFLERQYRQMFAELAGLGQPGLDLPGVRHPGQ